MHGILDTAIYLATAPVRLFGRSRRCRRLLGAIVVVAAFFAATLWALDRFMPADNNDARRAVANLPAPPPLQPVSRTSYVIAPVAVALSAIRQSLDAAAPRDLAGKNDNPVSENIQLWSLLKKLALAIV